MTPRPFYSYVRDLSNISLSLSVSFLPSALFRTQTALRLRQMSNNVLCFDVAVIPHGN